MISVLHLSDLGFTINWLEASSQFEVIYKGEYWGVFSLSSNTSILEALTRHSLLIDIYYGRNRVAL